MKLKDYFNIPNCLSYLRIMLLPVFMVLYLNAKTTKDYRIAFAVIIFSLLTDVFDGMIARKLNMVTDFGKALDPIADKLTQFVLALTLIVKYRLLLVFAIIFAVKEFCLGLVNLYIINTGRGVNSAKWWGKIATTIIDILIVAMFVFPNMPNELANTFIIIMIVSTSLSAIGYIIMCVQIIKNNPVQKTN